MSATLWHYFFQDDFESFRKFLADATYISGAPKSSGNTVTPKLGSSPGTSTARKVSGNTHDAGSRSVRDSNPQGHTPHHRGILSRSTLNARDSFGRTLLHYAASSKNDSALDFVTALLDIPLVDIYSQDTESGWTALHRALYFGNISIAHALMLRDVKDATDFTTTVSHNQAGGLVKIKDHEGNSPFEVFGLTIAPRTIQTVAQRPPIGAGEDDAGNSVDMNEDLIGNSHETGRQVRAIVNLQGDEVFAFGSNKNLSLGLGDEDDRQYPERLILRRPDHLLHLLQQEHDVMRESNLPKKDLSSSFMQASHVAELPAVTQHRPIIVQDVVMSKMHGAVLTNDPISNLYVCGFGPGGRLGTGDEATRFNYVSIQGGGLSHKHVSAIALGQDHSVAICSRGEVFTWGSNRHGQLGYALPDTTPKEIPMQLVPRQLYGHVKKELIIGAAASAIHSAIFTSTGLYTFGKNEGQLGLMDSDARSLDAQIIPRQVGVSVLRSPIQSVSAIDRATTVLLENHEVIVFTHYGFTKVIFQLEGFTNFFISDSYKQGPSWNYYLEGSNAICKVTSGGNTICALSTFGEIFTIDASRKSEAIPMNVSTTNPTKARNALPTPLKLWSIKKAHMSAIDVATGQDGSVIICTAAGSVWRKEKRAKIKSIGDRDLSSRTKDYKFVRVPNLTRAVAVRSNAFGAFTAIRRDCDVTKEQTVVDPPSIWENLFDLLPFREFTIRQSDYDSPNPRPRFWTSVPRERSPAQIKQAILASPDAETEFKNLMVQYEPLAETQYDMWITSNVTDVCIPIHSFVIKARSTVVRHALAEFQSTYYFSIPDILSIEYGPDGQIRAKFHGADFLTIMNLVFYLYTENFVDVWHHTSKALESAARYRQVRTELMRIATHLDLSQMEQAVRIMVDPAKSLQLDFEDAILDPDFFSDADLLIELADNVEVPAHSVLLCARCPFFEGLFHGRAGGRWMATRRSAAEIASDAVRVDLKHIEPKIFDMVLRHIYADSGAEFFDKVVTEDLDEFIDLIIEVLAVANELMLDRLAQICQQQLGKYVNTRNVCQLLNAVSGCSVKEFKHVALEYICLNLESMLEHRLLAELDEDLLLDLESVIRQNQLAFMPFARSERCQNELFERHPNLANEIDLAKQRRIDSMRLRSRFVEDEDRPVSSGKMRVGSWDRMGSSPLAQHQSNTTPSKHRSPATSPALLPNDAQNEDLFEMDEDRDTSFHSHRLGTDLPSPSLRPHDYPSSRTIKSPADDEDGWLDNRGRPIPGSNGTDASSLAGSIRRPTLGPRPMGTGDLIFGSVESPRSAWKTSTSTTRMHIDLRDVMGQTPTLSSLSRGLNAISSSALRPVPKMSQKERKKLQQEQSGRSKGMEAASSESLPIVRAAGEILSATSSPWKKIQATQVSQILMAPKQAESIDTASQSTPSKTAMTMRQTVSGGSTATRDERPKPNQGVSGPIIMSPAPQIQSIRHTTVSSNNSFVDARTSMADILAQQQTEKTAVKEAVAPRSLQEIQQEQEFQQWWDSESRRVQDEEAQRANPSVVSLSGRRGKAGRGRGRGGARRGSGKGSAGSTGDAATKGDIVAEQTTASPPVDTSRGGRRGRGRGIGVRGARSSTT